MICPHARELFSAAVDEALSPDERAALDAHLASCAECRRELERLRGTVGLLRAVAPARAPAGLVDRILEAARPRPWWRRLGDVLFRPLAVKLPMEVAALGLIALTALYLQERPGELQQAARPTAAPPAAESRRETPPRAAPESPPARPAEPAPSRGRGDVQRDLGRATPRPSTPAPAPARDRSERSSQPSPSAVREASPEASEETRKSATADRSRALAKTASPPDLSGSLAVADRSAAELALAALLGRLGGREIARRTETGALVVDLVLPAEAYTAFLEGLAQMGRWELDHEPAALPSPFRLTLRITD